MADNNVMISQEVQTTLDDWKSGGKSVALAAISIRSQTKETGAEEYIYSSWQLAAIFSISDPIRPESPAIIQALQNRGLQVWMLSGDNEITANAIGSQVGILSSNIIAGVLPSQKAEKIQYLQKSLKSRRTFAGTEHSHKRALVAMIGDGINDSPALTTSDVGIAIGSGSDIAISSAEFVLVSSNLNGLITLLDLSKVVFRRIKFNFAWALVYNMIALPVAAGVLYPIVSGGTHVRLDPVWASLAMAASSISVVCSSLALRSGVPWVGFRVRETVG
jgi:Cu+-exporting ATPase